MLYNVVSFYHIANKLNHMYTYSSYVPSLLDLPPIQITTKHWVEFPVLYSMCSLVIYFIHSIGIVYASIPISQFLLPLSLLVSIYLFCTSVLPIIVKLFLCLATNSPLQAKSSFRILEVESCHSHSKVTKTPKFLENLQFLQKLIWRWCFWHNLK